MTETAPESPAPTTRRQGALQRRLARMREHKDFPAAMEHVPPTEEDLERALSKLRWGGLTAVVGAALLALGLTGGGLAFTILGGAALVAGLALVVRGLAGRSAHLSNPLVRTPALVSDRRSETAIGKLGGRTTYYFQLELEDGNSREFRYPGRGVQDDLLVKGLTGVAFLRGDTLIAWKNIKV